MTFKGWPDKEEINIQSTFSPLKVKRESEINRLLAAVADSDELFGGLIAGRSLQGGTSGKLESRPSTRRCHFV